MSDCAKSQHEPRRWRGQVFIACSVDGLIARQDGAIDWVTDPPVVEGHSPAGASGEGPEDYEGFMRSIGHIVVGRATYELAASFDSWPYTSKQVIVLSTTLPSDIDHRVTVAGSVGDAVRLLNGAGAQGVYVDGGKVIQEFLRHGLIDEITVTRAPVLLGDGRPLFGKLTSDIRLVHVGTSILDGGMTSTLYHVSR